MKVQRRPWSIYLVMGLLCVLLGLATSMCGSDSEGQGDSTGGRLTLLLVDDPIDSVTSLNVRIESIEVHGNGPPRELTLNQNVVVQPVNISGPRTYAGNYCDTVGACVGSSTSLSVVPG
jgi:hypothetical protein